MRRLSALLFVVAIVLASCAKHAPEPTPHPSLPHISWSVAEGYGDKHVCRSTEKTPCVLDVSDEQPNRRVGIFHLFLHAADTDTRYVGTYQIGFLVADKSGAHAHQVDRTVPRGSDPVNMSSTGLVAAAGTYYVDVALTATPAKGPGGPVEIKERIRVDVSERRLVHARRAGQPRDQKDQHKD